ncbi:CocE/NonD family hydrolase [Nocardia sp. NPDC004068]|uniref:CocE/NonD family hydrolase n=1 Tax=Nocardia sp. NPDC004068 TaxID=3364303 RepID=UPI0036C87D51
MSTNPTALPVHIATRFDIGEPRWPRTHWRGDVSIRASDGELLLADIGLPADERGVVDVPVPAVVCFTPYNKTLIRAFGSRPARNALRAWATATATGPRGGVGFLDLIGGIGRGALDTITTNDTLVSRGYAIVLVDVRGTGSSTGTWDFHGEHEQRDYTDVLAWVRAQPWCDGRIAVSGISYHAQAALLAAARQPPGLAAVFAIEPSTDPTREIGLSGGVPSPFILAWSASINLAKLVPSPSVLRRPRLLARLVRDRLAHPIPWFGLMLAVLASDRHPHSYLNAMWARNVPDVTAIRVPTFLVGAWHDIYSGSVWHIYERLPQPPGAKQLLIGQGYHLSPVPELGGLAAPPALDELQCAWFDRWIRGIDNGIDRYGPITLRSQGDGWVRRRVFPDPDAGRRKFHLTADASGSAGHAHFDGTLAARPPDSARRIELDAHSLPASDNAARATVGLATLLGRDFGRDERRAERAAATFTSPPLRADLTLSGPVALHLYVEAGSRDAFWAATLSDVAPDGRSVALSSGALRSSMRRLSPDTPRYPDGDPVEPVHPLTAESEIPAEPHRPHSVDIDLHATEALVRAGHRLRISVTRNSFPRYLLTPSIRRNITTQAILLDPAHPGHLTVRVLPADPPTDQEDA